MTRSKLERIRDAVFHRDEAELRWALAECELGKRLRTGHSALWHEIENTVGRTLAEIRNHHIDLYRPEGA